VFWAQITSIRASQHGERRLRLGPEVVLDAGPEHRVAPDQVVERAEVFVQAEVRGHQPPGLVHLRRGEALEPGDGQLEAGLVHRPERSNVDLD
jgi:hypothetical protein